MKRYIKSSFNKIDPEKLLRSISTYIKQFIPKNCKVRLTPRHDAIELYENCPQSEERIRSAIKKVLEGLGYECTELNRDWGITIAAMKDNRWIELGYIYDDFNEGLITIASDNSNDIEEDVMGSTQLNEANEAGGTVYQMSEQEPTRLSIYKRQLKEVREDIEQFENTPKRLRHPEYNKRLAELKRKEASLIKWISEDEEVNTKRLIKASTLWDQGWSKRLNKDSGETYFVFTCPKATGYVSKGLDTDGEGKYNSQAEVHFLRDDIYLKKTFFGKDSEFDAMAWAEDVIFER